MMREGKADIHASLYLSEEREEYLTYAAIVASSQGMVFYHKSIININAPGDSKAFRLGVVQNSYHEQYIKQTCARALLVSYPEISGYAACRAKRVISGCLSKIGRQRPL